MGLGDWLLLIGLGLAALAEAMRLVGRAEVQDERCDDDE